MPKAWRRTASAFGGGGSLPPVSPIIVSAIYQAGSNTTLVTFSSNVTWDGVSPGTWLVNGSPVNWLSQVAGNVIESDSTANVPTPWSWSAADVSLTPTPAAAQTGLTS